MSENLDRSLPATSTVNRRLCYWLPPLLWMAAIFWFSTDEFSAENTGSLLGAILHWLAPQMTDAQIQVIHFYLRKAGHFSVYAVLALLLVRAFRSGSLARWQFRWALYSFFIVSVYALLDEYHQSFTRHRTASVYDSLIDMSGGFAALCLLGLMRGYRRGARTHAQRGEIGPAR